MIESMEMTGGESTGSQPDDTPPVESQPVEKPVRQSKAKKSTAKKSATKPAAKKGKATKGKVAGKKAGRKVEKVTVKLLKPANGTGTDRALPKIGSIIEKLDRHGAIRAKCEVVEGGVRYKSKVYGSLSSAAMAAAADLGLKATALNGWVFWGLVKTTPAIDPVEAVQKLSARIIERTRSAMTGDDDDVRAGVEKAVRQHLTALGKLVK